MSRFSSVLFFAFLSAVLSAQSITDISDTTVHSSFRGLSVVNDNVVWLSGTKGTVGNSFDGGKTWQWHTVKGFEQLDFRSLYAMDKKKAAIASAGTPAVILTTADGGATWETRFRSDDTLMFLDGVDFWDNNHGLVFGDPVNGKMFIAETVDGGKTWNEVPEKNRPQLDKGEASFAASNTTMRTVPGGEVWIATGGYRSRLWHSLDYGHHWSDVETPILQGVLSAGIFSFAIGGKDFLLITGGDYLQDTLTKKNFFYTVDGGAHWLQKSNNPGGYRSCIEKTGKNQFICTGTSGTDIMEGPEWKPLSPAGYNCVRKSRSGSAVYFCGAKGKIGKLVAGG
ncbi:MAG TPA: YCF48-related protein [Bacteroidia bacterium]|nr:YCF48-related protein [Bacteroidia bacterium]